MQLVPKPARQLSGSRSRGSSCSRCLGTAPVTPGWGRQEGDGDAGTAVDTGPLDDVHGHRRSGKPASRGTELPLLLVLLSSGT